MVSRKHLKGQAREAYSAQRKQFVLGYLILWLLGQLLSLPNGITLIPSYTMRLLLRIPGVAATPFGTWDGKLWGGIYPSLNLPNRVLFFVGLILMIVIPAITCAAHAAYDDMCLRANNGEQVSALDVFVRYKEFGRWFALYLSMMIPIVVLSYMLFVPGIIVALSYSQALFLMLEDSDLKPQEALRKSAQLMNGYKADFFGLCLSFTGMVVLSALTFGLAGFYTIPYMRLTYAGYYQALKADYKESSNGNTANTGSFVE
jgi:hypothetical protein